MVRHYGECAYCRIVNNNGLIYTMCRDCKDLVPNHIPEEQHHNYLKEYYGIQKRRTVKMRY